MAVVLVSLAARVGQTQETIRGGDPVQVVRAFLDAVAQERWLAAGAFLDPGPLEQQRLQVMRWHRRPPPAAELTVETYLKLDPTMPRAVAEYNVAQTKRQREESNDGPFAYTYAGVRDTAGLMQLTPVELAASWLQPQDSRYSVRRSIRGIPNCRHLTDSLVAEMLRPKRAVLGSVERGDTSYVLHKDMTAGAEEAPLGDPVVTTLHKRDGVWRIAPSEMLLRGGRMMGISCDETGSGQTDTTRMGTRRPPD